MIFYCLAKKKKLAMQARKPNNLLPLIHRDDYLVDRPIMERYTHEYRSEKKLLLLMNRSAYSNA